MTKDTDYRCLEKCYSIWVCRDDVPKDERFSISFIEMANTRNYGKCHPAKKNYDLLSLVKMDKKAANLNIEPVDINDLLELILKRLRPIAARKNIEMVLESFRPVTAEVDAGRLSLAFTNLMENAVKYNKENGWVHVSLDADHKFFYVKVMDSGMGIPEESLNYIFERFYRVDKSHSNEIDGTGLGLAITRSAILMHRGTVKVTSVEGEGTDFTVKIPLKYIAV